MANTIPGGHPTGFGATSRTDNWWVGPAATVAGLGLALGYLTIFAFAGKYYMAGPYLSPLYSPLMFAKEGVPGGAAASDALFGAWPGWWPSFLPASPAALTFGMPAVFRATCYYYRKAYYRAFFGMPPGCAVGPVPLDYRGESGLLIVQNLHRYTLYLAILLLPVLFWEAFKSMYWHGHGFGIGLGTVLLFINATLLSSYTLGCHAWRHLVGGRLNCFSCDGGAETSHKVWSRVSWLNASHMQFAWASLGFFVFTELYIRLMSMGIVPDINTWQGITWFGA